jgi:hypothetical protein
MYYGLGKFAGLIAIIVLLLLLTLTQMGMAALLRRGGKARRPLPHPDSLGKPLKGEAAARYRKRMERKRQRLRRLRP